MRVCAACGQENPEVARFCLACGAPIVAEPEAPRQERKLVTGVFVDVVGSTARAESLDPEDVRALLEPYHWRVRAELERFGGTVEKFIGDAVFALFGAPVARENDAERAVRAAFALLDAVAELNRADEWLDLHVRVGVHTGEALVRLDANAAAGDWVAAGDIVNTAARIQAAAPPDAVLVGELTRSLTRSVVEYDEAEPVAAKGKAEPVPVWLARALRADDADRDAPAADRDVVGREAETRLLVETWEGARRGRRPALVTILGPPGIGKSTLTRQLRRHAGAGGGAVHASRCLPYGEGITYWPITEILKSLAGILQSDSELTDRTKLARLIERLPTTDRDELRTIAAACATLIGSQTTPAGTYTSDHVGQEELHWGLRRTFHLLAEQSPLLLVVEDVHWAEPTLLELLRLLADAGADVPLVLLCSARPELRESRPDFVAAGTTVELASLDEAAARALLATLVGSRELADTPTGTSIVEIAGGNPLFLEELVEAVAERGLTPDRWSAEGTLDDLAVPKNLQALIASRLDLLRPRDKEVAQHASVVGHVFWSGAVAHVESRERETLAQPLAVLEQRDFVHPCAVSSVDGEDEYSFKHILVRDVAYASLPKGERIPMHVRFAEWLERLPGPRDEFVEIVAWHLEQACRLCTEVARPPVEPPVEAAVDALGRAAGKAERREGLREANRFYERALTLAADASAEAVSLRLRRAATLTALGELRTACHELTDAEAGARDLGRDDLRSAALVALAEIDRRQGRIADARAALANAAALAAQDDLEVQVRLRFVRAALRANADGETDAALVDLQDATRLARELGETSLLAEAELRTAALLMNAGRLAEAETVLAGCAERAGAEASLVVEAEATAWLGGMRYYVGDLEGGKRLGLQAAEWLERTGDSYFLVQNLVWLAAFALLEHDPETAERHLRRAVPVALEIGGWVVVQVYRYLTEALLALGRLDEARELTAFAARNLPEEDAYARTELLLAEGAVATASNEHTAAVAAFSEALRVLEGLNMPAQLAESRLAFARSLAAAGDEAAAAVELTRARSAFARMGAQALVDVVDADLRALERRAPAAT